MKPKGILVQHGTSPLTEAGLSRVYRHWDEHGFAIVSAQRGERTDAENARHTAALKSRIRADGYGFIPLRGYWTETDANTGEKKRQEEISFLIPARRDGGDPLGDLRRDALKWGKRDEQESVILAEPGGPVRFLDPKDGRETFKLTQFVPGKVADIYSTLRNKIGKRSSGTFVFEGWAFSAPPTSFGEASRRQFDGEVAFVSLAET